MLHIRRPISSAAAKNRSAKIPLSSFFDTITTLWGSLAV
jgi:hypothetical protein